jgi:iron-sulfur cluster repair protein YtfE (RIC family)
MNGIDANITLGELVNEKPASVSLLERLRLDYCCGGGQTLAEACTRTVVRVHGPSHAGLHDLQRAFVGMSEELLAHLKTEEHVLFPAARRLELDGVPVDGPLFEKHEQDHEHVGDSLTALRELTSDYRTDSALCSTHRALLDALQSLERDLHQHVHEENNVLFPRVRALSAPASPSSSAKRGRDT